MTCEQTDRTIFASHLASLERFAKAGKATQDKPAALGRRVRGAGELHSSDANK
jgi:hypothetical protein